MVIIVPRPENLLITFRKVVGYVSKQSKKSLQKECLVFIRYDYSKHTRHLFFPSSSLLPSLFLRYSSDTLSDLPRSDCGVIVKLLLVFDRPPYCFCGNKKSHGRPSVGSHG